MMKPFAFVTAFMAMSPAFAADYVVAVGQVTVLDPMVKVSTVVVADPTVADVATEGDSTVMVMARKVGRTDVLLLDERRRVLERNSFTVAATTISDHVTIRRARDQGVAEEVLMCAPGRTCAKVDGK